MSVAFGTYATECDTKIFNRWGAEGGKTMMALFRRLRSPSSLSFSRA